jgi:hypothetical protein
MLRQACAKCDLVVLDDEDCRHSPHRGEVQPLVKNARLRASVTNPREDHIIAPLGLHGERDPVATAAQSPTMLTGGRMPREKSP